MINITEAEPHILLQAWGENQLDLTWLGEKEEGSEYNKWEKIISRWILKFSFIDKFRSLTEKRENVKHDEMKI